MLCPYCGEEMMRGYIQCRDEIWWSEKNEFSPLSCLWLGKSFHCQKVMVYFKGRSRRLIAVNNAKKLLWIIPDDFGFKIYLK